MCISSRVIQKPFGLSLSKTFSSLRKKGKRFDKLTANGVLQRFRDGAAVWSLRSCLEFPELIRRARWRLEDRRHSAKPAASLEKGASNGDLA
jgi:hypothetical protein